MPFDTVAIAMTCVYVIMKINNYMGIKIQNPKQFLDEHSRKKK